MSLHFSDNFCMAEWLSIHLFVFHSYLVVKFILILAVMLQMQQKPCYVTDFCVVQVLEYPVAMKVSSEQLLSVKEIKHSNVI